MQDAALHSGASATRLPAAEADAELLSVNALAKRYAVDRKALTDWITREHVPVTLVSSWRVGTFAVERRVDVRVVGPQLEARRCPAAGCERIALGESGICQDHLNGLTRKQPAEVRTCEYCGDEFTLKHPSVGEGGRGRFCPDPKKCRYDARRVHARPEPRPCANAACDVVFTPSPAQAARGDGLYCSMRCAGTAREGLMRAGALERNAAAETAIRSVEAEHGLWSRARAAEFLGVDAATILYYEERRYLTRALVVECGHREAVTFYRPSDIKRVGRDTRRRSRHTPDELKDWLIARGVPLERAKEIKRRRQEADERIAKARAGKPQPRPMEQRTRRWRQMLDELEERFAFEQPSPSREELLRVVALDDWCAHPKAWPRDDWPADPTDPENLAPVEYRRAANRIHNALNRLQIAHL